MKKFLTLFAALLFSVGAAAQNETATMIETPHIKAPEGAFLPLGLPATDVFWTAPYRDWTGKKAWDDIDVGAAHAIR